MQTLKLSCNSANHSHKILLPFKRHGMSGG